LPSFFPPLLLGFGRGTVFSVSASERALDAGLGYGEYDIGQHESEDERAPIVITNQRDELSTFAPYAFELHLSLSSRP
jgi:hypothetical protein